MRQPYLPKTTPGHPGRPQGLGHAWDQPGDSFCKALTLGFKTRLFVCLSLGNREDGKNVNVILSPMSHRSARVEIPRSWKGTRGTPKAAHSSSPCLSGPALTPSPSPQMGTRVAWAHRWPGETSVARGQLREPWKARQEFAFLFAFPNCACGFPGAAACSGFHGRFCADLENRGRHKEATMDLPLTRIKGGRRGGPGAPRTGQPSTGGPSRQGGQGGWWPMPGDTRGSSGGDVPC